MKSLTAISTTSLCLGLAMLSCSTAASPPPADQAGSSNGGASPAAGGSQGGSTPDLGGSPAVTAGTGGDTTTTAGSGGADVGGGGTTSLGGSDGTAAGTGGGTANGGTAGGGIAGGGTAGGGVVDTTLVGSWDGALLEYSCGSTGSGYDCQQPASTKCTSYNSTNKTVSSVPPSNGVPSSWTIGGNPSTVYNVTMHIRGVVEVVSYDNTKRAAGDTTSITVQPRNLFAVGGTPVTASENGFDYNTYELDVSPAVAGAANVYFLNAVSTAQNPHGTDSNATQHLTFDIDYSATIKVPGGGKVSLTVKDSNCTEVQNCGDTQGNTCAHPRSVVLSGSTPAPPPFIQPFSNTSGTKTFYGQWVFFDITAVTVAQ